MASSNKRKHEQNDEGSLLKKVKSDEDPTPCLGLPELLDFSTLGTTAAAQIRFDKIAHTILHDFVLVIRCGTSDTFFDILELEFYLQKAGCHEDPFTHGSEEQKISGRWYFHRAPKRSLDSNRSGTSLTGYRGGTRKGLDLTLGSPPSPEPIASNSHQAPLLRGGALLRTIRRVSDTAVISGPSLLVDEILRVSKAASIAELVADKWRGNTSAFLPLSEGTPAAACLFLQPRDSSPGRSTIYSSPRIGIDLSHPGTTTFVNHPRVMYLPRPYRYFVHPHLLTANGRPQTFLGILRSILDSGMTLDDKKLDKELALITGLKLTSVHKYLDDYRSGMERGSLKAFVGPAGKGAASSPTTYLRMMGILERLRNSQM